jgi:transposase-like protein
MSEPTMYPFSFEVRYMQTAALAQAGSFCCNQECPDYSKVNAGHLRKFGQTRKGVPRRQCKTCKKVFAITKGTLFYRLRHSQQTVSECLGLVAERNSLAAIHRVKGVKEETTTTWIHKAALHCQQVEQVVLADYQPVCVQMDALWTFVGRKGLKGGDPKPQNKAISGGEPL